MAFQEILNELGTSRPRLSASFCDDEGERVVRLVAPHADPFAVDVRAASCAHIAKQLTGSLANACITVAVKNDGFYMIQSVCDGYYLFVWAPSGIGHRPTPRCLSKIARRLRYEM